MYNISLQHDLNIRSFNSVKVFIPNYKKNIKIFRGDIIDNICIQRDEKYQKKNENNHSKTSWKLDHIIVKTKIKDNKPVDGIGVVKLKFLQIKQNLFFLIYE